MVIEKYLVPFPIRQFVLKDLLHQFLFRILNEWLLLDLVYIMQYIA